MRRLLALAAAMAGASALAQIPDVTIKVDAGLTYRSVRNGETTLRWYDGFGKHSTVGLLFWLEPGWRVYVSERLQRIEGDGDNEQLDEYYVEDPGIWRLGKQYLPFGRGLLLRESARAARGDTNLLVERLPISAAVFDNGPSRDQGVVARFGEGVAFSVAVGRHLGIQGTSLTAIRRPEQSPGAGAGHRFVAGVDFGTHWGRYPIEGEFALFRNGHTASDGDLEVSDIVLHLQRAKGRHLAAAWSRNWTASEDFFRVTGAIALTNQLWAEPYVRATRRGVYDVGVSVRVKL